MFFVHFVHPNFSLKKIEREILDSNNIFLAEYSINTMDKKTLD